MWRQTLWKFLITIIHLYKNNPWLNEYVWKEKWTKHLHNHTNVMCEQIIKEFSIFCNFKNSSILWSLNTIIWKIIIIIIIWKIIIILWSLNSIIWKIILEILVNFSWNHRYLNEQIYSLFTTSQLYHLKSCFRRNWEALHQDVPRKSLNDVTVVEFISEKCSLLCCKSDR